VIPVITAVFIKAFPQFINIANLFYEHMVRITFIRTII
jgi:hypothetical protein